MMRANSNVMVRRTYEADAICIETADDFNDFVQDKRESWRTHAIKARRIQRLCKKRLTNNLIKIDYSDDQ